MTRWSAQRWLRDFRAVGGMVWKRHDDGSLLLGWMVEDRSEDEQATARTMYRELSANIRRWNAVAREVGPVPRAVGAVA